MFWKGIVTELLWFLKGDTNIKYLIDNGVNIWNEDAYNYYLKQPGAKKCAVGYSFEEFVEAIKNEDVSNPCFDEGYRLGDCGYQYGKVWRHWEVSNITGIRDGELIKFGVDQIKNLIEGLRKTPESRRHIVTAIDPAHDRDLALYWCHAMFQFNCRPIDIIEKMETIQRMGLLNLYTTNVEKQYEELNLPKYYLDCQLYQRSADAVLGVPFNIASYALLTHIIAKTCNMIPGEFIHTFGDVHIYDNHKEAVEEQLSRTPGNLPTLNMWWSDQTDDLIYTSLDDFFECISQSYGFSQFNVEGYNPQPTIKAELSTGLKK